MKGLPEGFLHCPQAKVQTASLGVVREESKGQGKHLRPHLLNRTMAVPGFPVLA